MTINQYHRRKLIRIEEKRHWGREPLAWEVANRFLQCSESRFRFPIDCEPILRSSLRRGTPWNLVRSNDYSIFPITTGSDAVCGPVRKLVEGDIFRLNPDTNERFDVCIDAPFGFCLKYSDIPLAIVSFDLFADRFAECRQLQGVASEKFLEPRGGNIARNQIAWPLVLLKWCLQWAELEGLEFGVATGFYNRWTTEFDDDGIPHLSPFHAIRRYDLTALRLAFRLVQWEDRSVDVTHHYLGNIKAWQRSGSGPDPPYPKDLVWVGPT